MKKIAVFPANPLDNTFFSWYPTCAYVQKSNVLSLKYLWEIEDMLIACPAIASLEEKEHLEKLWERYLSSMQSEPRFTNRQFMWDPNPEKNNGLTQHTTIYPPDSMVLESMNDAIAALIRSTRI